MDDTDLTTKEQQEKMEQEGRVPCESPTVHVELNTEVQLFDGKNTSKEANRGNHSSDGPEHHSSHRLIQENLIQENPEVSQSSPSNIPEDRISASHLTLVSASEMLSTACADRNCVNVISDKYSLHEMKKKHEVAVSPPRVVVTAGGELTKESSESKTVAGNNNLLITSGESPVQSPASEVAKSMTGIEVPKSMTGIEVPKSMTGIEVPKSMTGIEVPKSMIGVEVPKSLTGMEVLYNTARNTFEAQPQRSISGMDVLYTAATASQLNSGTMNSVPGIDVLYARSLQQMSSEMPNSVSSSSVLHNSTDMCNMMQSHQSSGPRAVVTSAEYSIPHEASQNKLQNAGYDNNAYEKFKQFAAAQAGISFSSARFPLASNSIVQTSETSTARFPLPSNTIVQISETSNTRFPLSSDSIVPISETSNVRFPLPSNSIVQISETSSPRFPLPSNSIVQISDSSNTKFPLSSDSIVPSSESSNTRFLLPSNILSISGAQASTVSSYYSPQPAACSASDREGNRNGKQMVDRVEPNSHLGYYQTGVTGEVSSREYIASNFHPESTNCQSVKDYGRVLISLPNMNAVPFMESYNRYRSKVGIDETRTQTFTDYHHSDGNVQQQKMSSVTEMGPAQYGFNMQHEKVSNSNVTHSPEVHTRFPYHPNGPIGLMHSFDSGKQPPSQLSEFHQRDQSQTQHNFYPKITNCDSSSMYERPDMQKFQTHVYQELMQGSHVTYYQTDTKAHFETPIFPAGHTLGFHQINHGTVETQHNSHEKERFSRLESLEKTATLNSIQELSETNANILKKRNETSEHVIADSLSSSKSKQQTDISSSEHGTLYSDPHSLQVASLTESSSSRQNYEQNTPNEHYLQTGSYAEYAIQPQEKDSNAGQTNMPDTRTDMSSIKMKINAILESTSLQFDETVQQKSEGDDRTLYGGNSLPFKTIRETNADTKSDHSGNHCADEHETLLQGKSLSNELLNISCVNKTNNGFKSNSDSSITCSTGSVKIDKKVTPLNVSENSGNEKRSKKSKDSQNMVPGSSLKLKVKKEASVSDKKTITNVNPAEVTQATVSLNNEETVIKDNIPQYKCDMCQKEFSQLCSFQRHVRFHSGQPLFTCDLCGQGFNNLFLFVDHITEVDSEKLKQLKTIPEFVDSVQKPPPLTKPPNLINPPSLTKSPPAKTKRFGKRKFRRSKRLKRNNKSIVVKGTVDKNDPETVDGDNESSAMENEDLDPDVNMEDTEDAVKDDDDEMRVQNFKCNECGMQFNYARYLSAHLLTHSDQKSFKCQICSKEFSHGHSLNRHRKKVHPKVVIYSCNICGEGFSRFTDLKEHSNCHLADSSLKCKMCDQEFSCQRDLQVHVSSHTGGKAYQCDLCWKQFTQYCTLLRHKRRFDHSGGPPYKCKWCGEGFYEMGKLLSHSRKHMGSGPHKCDVCGKGFATTNNLKVHKSSVHSSEKPFCCDLCGDQFTRVSYLRQHIKTHTGDRPYVCELCGKGFGMQDTLSKHMRTHTGEKPYSCDKCGKQFSLTATLTVHKRTHTGERPYVCDVCGKGFIDNSSWNKHIKHHHKSPSGRETTHDNTTEVREATQSNYKTFGDVDVSVPASCLAKTPMGEFVKGRQIQLDGQFLTSQMTINTDTVQCTSSY